MDSMETTTPLNPILVILFNNILYFPNFVYFLKKSPNDARRKSAKVKFAK